MLSMSEARAASASMKGTEVAVFGGGGCLLDGLLECVPLRLF